MTRPINQADLIFANLQAANQLLGTPGLTVPRAVFTGQLANNCFIPNTKNAGNTTMMVRSLHFARDNITAGCQLVLANFYVVAGTGETGPGADATEKVAIEFPLGTTPIPLTFGSASTGTNLNGGMLATDPFPAGVSIPRGAMFAIRRYRTCTSGNIYTDVIVGHTITPDFGMVLSGATDLTNSNAPVYTNNPAYGLHGSSPVAIIGPTNRASFILYGDSRTMGAADTKTLKELDGGNLARSIGPDYALINAGISSETLVGFNAGSVNRRALAVYCTHQALQLGFNDLSSGAATVAARYTAAIALLDQTKPIITCTMEPATTSTDNWATASNQTVTATNAARLTENNRRRAGISGIAACWEIADPVEVASTNVLTRDGGFWLSPNPSTLLPLTDDGIHGTKTGNLVISDSGRVQAKGVGV